MNPKKHTLANAPVIALLLFVLPAAASPTAMSASSR